jgi:uncharacterized protein
MLQIPIFPLRTVLFPQGLLPLKIFEQRYLEMTKACIRDATPFGVCLIQYGSEVGEPAVPFQVGCTAKIEQWDMPHLGMFHLVCRGETVFRIVERYTAGNGLITALVQERPAPTRQALRAEHQQLGALLEQIIDKLGSERFPAPLALDDAEWVGLRLAEALPLEPTIKQGLLEADDAHARLDQLVALLRDRSIVIEGA